MDLVEMIHTPEAQNALSGLLKFLKNYFRIEIEGLENLPPTGQKGLVCPNHSGFAGTDAVLLADLIHEHTGRRPRILAHRAFFDFSKQIKARLRKFRPAEGFDRQRRRGPEPQASSDSVSRRREGEFQVLRRCATGFRNSKPAFSESRSSPTRRSFRA